jgi:hypothetical protein
LFSAGLPGKGKAAIPYNMGSYRALASLMSTYPDVFIVRRFSELNVMNLLYLQAELAHLEQELKEIEDEDRLCEAWPRKRFATDWKSLGIGSRHKYNGCSESTIPTPRDSLQWQTFLKIRETLSKYSQ